MPRALRNVIGCLAAWLYVLPGHAQSDELPWTTDDDPIGLRREDTELDRGPAPTPTPDTQAFGPKPPASSARRGDVLTAPVHVKESAHRVHVTWSAGLALVQTELHIESSSERGAEVQYRLPIADDAQLTQLRVCLDDRCRDGVAVDASAPSAYDDAIGARGGSGFPIADARVIRDDRGRAVRLRAAPVRAGQPLTLLVTWWVNAPMRGGVVRLGWPARGMDERAAGAELSFEAPDLTGVAVGGVPVSAAPTWVETWQPITFVGRLVSTRAIATRRIDFACGTQRCVHLWIGARPTPVTSDDVALLLDASPSMQGPARSRLAHALVALLSLLPPSQSVTVAVFAARARLLADAVAVEQIALAPWIDAALAGDLGSGTRLADAWRALAPWLARRQAGKRKRLIVLGDGTIGRGQEDLFQQASDAGVTIHWVNLADTATSTELRAQVESTGGVVLDAGRAANGAQGGDAASLEETLSLLLARDAATAVSVHWSAVRPRERQRLGRLGAGDQIAWRGPARGPAHLLGHRGDPQRVERLGTALTPQGHRAVHDRLASALEHAEQDRSALVAVDAVDLGRAGLDRPHSSTTCDPRGPAQRASGVSSDVDPISLAEPRTCPRPGGATRVDRDTERMASRDPGVGMPSMPLLTMLRQRIMPLARGCFRRDRAGRAEYELRAVFVLELSNQEVTDIQIEGDVPETLRTCLREATDQLEVPLFTGVVRARYPLRTQSEPLPDEIELSKEVASDLDRLLDAPGGALHTPPAF